MRCLVTLALTGILGLGACSNGGIVSDDEAVFQLSNNPLPDATVGVTYDAQIPYQEGKTPVGGLTVHGQLPPGIYFVDSLAFRLGGVPTDTGTYAFTITGWCYGTNQAGQSDQQSYSIIVKP